MGFADTNNGMYMPVAPAFGYGGMGGGFGNGLNGDGWWILIILLAMWGGNWGGNGLNGGNMGYPLMAMNTNGDVQRGFDQAEVMSGLTSLTGAVSGVNQNICNSTAAITQAVNSGFASAEIANNARQMADMNQNFASQTAITGFLTNLQAQLAQCCCDNQLATANLTSIIVSESAATRNAINEVGRNILDTMCQNKIDDLQRALSAKDTQIAMLNLKSDNLANTNAIVANNEAQTAILRQALNPTPVLAYPAQYPSWNNYGFNGGNCGWNNGCCGN